MRRLGRGLLLIGGFIVGIAIAWWWVTYRDVVQYAYLTTREASACLIGRSDICDLARGCAAAPIRPRSLYISYWWGTFWLGIGIVSASLTMTGATQT